jgi:hypothetical protein
LKLGRTGSRNKKHSVDCEISENENGLVIKHVTENTNQTTASSSGIGSSAEPKTGMTTVISTDGSASGGSESTDVPHSTGNHSNVADGKKHHIKDYNHTSSPRKKFAQHIEMSNNTSSSSLEKFQTLTSTKQNVELFKILTAIAVEIDSLQKSTEKRFSLLENLVGTDQDHQQMVSDNLNLAVNDNIQTNSAQLKVL